MAQKCQTRVLLAAVTCFAAACDPDRKPYPDVPGDWSEAPEACAEFWDDYFPAAVAGDPRSAQLLFGGVAYHDLIPPGRDPENYTREQRGFDLLSLMRLSVSKYAEPSGDILYSDRLRRIGFMQNVIYFDLGAHDFHRNALQRLGEYIGYTWPEFEFKEGICEQRTGLSHETNSWASSCRQILSDDKVLPSTEDWVSTIPEDTRACGYQE